MIKKYEENEVKNKVYEFVNQACKELDYWIVSMYSTNHFVLMDSETETPNEYDLEELVNELSNKSHILAQDLLNEAKENGYPYNDKDFS